MRAMEQETIDREKLTDYLLGNLSEEEQDAIAERYFIDDEVFDLLSEVKADLIDQYVRGQLPAADRPQFEYYLNNLADGWHEVAVARSLIKIVDGKPKPVGWLQTLAAWLAQPVPALATIFGLITLGGIFWLFLYSQRLSNDNERLLAQMQERGARQTESVVEIERMLTKERARSSQLQQELEVEKRRRETQPPVRLSAFQLPLVKWPLSSTRVRGSDQPSEALRLDSKAKTIALIIEDKGEKKYTGYKVDLRTEDGKRILWKDSQPYTSPMRLGKDIVFYRPASDFDASSYKLTLTLVSPQETTTRDYYFTVA